MKPIKLSKVKVNEVYQFNAVADGGAGSGSQVFYNIVGRVKEVNAEFIRVFKNNGSRQSYKIYNNTITKIYSI